jgi:putative RNA 2'-phosphotransferase
VLYHGTVEKNRASIEEKGLLRGARLYVHLSKDVETAMKVAARRKGEKLICEVKAGEMHRAGYSFYLSVNGVWLTEAVPGNFITLR